MTIKKKQMSIKIPPTIQRCSKTENTLEKKKEIRKECESRNKKMVRIN